MAVRRAGRHRERAAPLRRHADADALLARRPERARGGRPSRVDRRGASRDRRRSTPPRSRDAHARYAAERDAAIPPGHRGPRPSGGVGGTRTGVKCLHAHLAWYLAGGRDPVGRWVADELAGEHRGPVGAIDCGTNSTRLLIVGRSGATLERRMTITRLGEGVDDRGFARRGGHRPHHRRPCGATAGCSTTTASSRSGPPRPRPPATRTTPRSSSPPPSPSSACARSCSPARRKGGSPTGRDGRARRSDGPYLVVDLGGGSTELVVRRDADPAPSRSVSLDVGCVRVTERFLASDPPTRGRARRGQGLRRRGSRPRARGAARAVAAETP